MQKSPPFQSLDFIVNSNFYDSKTNFPLRKMGNEALDAKNISSNSIQYIIKAFRQFFIFLNTQHQDNSVSRNINGFEHSQTQRRMFCGTPSHEDPAEVFLFVFLSFLKNEQAAILSSLGSVPNYLWEYFLFFSLFFSRYICQMRVCQAQSRCQIIPILHLSNHLAIDIQIYTETCCSSFRFQILKKK